MTLRLTLLQILCLLLAFSWAPEIISASPTEGQSYGNGRLILLGDGLVVSPAQQTVPPAMPTIISTSLSAPDLFLNYPDALVFGEWFGPGMEQPVELSALPGEPFYIPGQSEFGLFTLSNIRLMSGDLVLAQASPNAATVDVREILITDVTTTPLTLEQIQELGIVLTDESFSGYSFSFAMVFDSEIISFNVPVVFDDTGISEPLLVPPPSISTPNTTLTNPFRFKAVHFKIPSLEVPSLPEPDSDFTPEPQVVRGLMVIPSDIGFLHQFFSVMIVVTNGAPDGDPLVIRNLGAEITFDETSLRRAQTDPPLDLEAPVPVHNPGEDGQLGSADDLPFLAATRMGKGEFLLEGLKEGTHPISIHLAGELDGLPVGPAPIEGIVRSSILVQDPDFSLTLTHPDTVRAGDQYVLSVTVLNTGQVPANLVNFTLPAYRLSGAKLLSDPQVTIETLLIGQSFTAEFNMEALLTGKVVATSVKHVGGVRGAFHLTMGIGEVGIPLSPETLRLPNLVHQQLPSGVVTPLIGLLGEAHSLATAPAGKIPAGLPAVPASIVATRAQDAIWAARYAQVGLDPLLAEATLWFNLMGREKAEGSFERLRLATSKGAALTEHFQNELNTRPQSIDQRLKFLFHGAGQVPTVLAGVQGDWSVAFLDGNGRAVGLPLVDGTLSRALPFADTLRLDTQNQILTLTSFPAWDPNLRLRLMPLQGGQGKPQKVILAIPENQSLKVLAWTFGSALEEPNYFQMLADFSLAPVYQDGSRGVPLLPTEEIWQANPLAMQGAVLDATVYQGARAVTLLLNQRVAKEDLLREENYLFSPAQNLAGVSPQADGRLVVLVTQTPINPFALDPEGLLESTIQLNDFSTVAVDFTPKKLGTLGTFRGGNILGQVVSAQGEPREGIQVLRYEPRISKTEGLFWVAVESVLTNLEGRYAFPFVPSRLPLLSRAGFQIKAVDTELNQIKSVSGYILEDGETRIINLALNGFGTLTGRVLNRDGEPLAGMYVTFALNNSQASGQTKWLSQSNAQGTFEKNQLPLGRYRLTAVNPTTGKRGYGDALLNEAGGQVSADVFLLDAAEGSLEVTLLDDQLAPMAGGYVLLYRRGGTTSKSDDVLLAYGRTGSDGILLLTGLPLGADHRIQIHDPNGLAWHKDIGVSIRADEVTTTTLVFPSQENLFGTFVGVVFDGAGFPRSGLQVIDGGTGIQDVTDAQGSFRLDNIPASGARALILLDQATGLFEKKSANLSLGGQEVYLEFHLDRYGSLQGQARNAGGTFAPGANLYLKNQAKDSSYLYTTTADADGNFFFPSLPTRSYVLQVVTTSGQGGWMNTAVAYHGQMAVANPRAFADNGVINIHIRNSDNSTPLVAPVELFPYMFNGASFTRPGAPITVTGDSEYQFSGLLEGKHFGYVQHPLLGAASFSVELSLDGEMSADVFLNLKNALTITGRVYMPDGTAAPQGSITLFSKSLSPAGLPLSSEDPGLFQFDQAPRDIIRLEAAAGGGLPPFRGVTYIAPGFSGDQLAVDVHLRPFGELRGQVSRLDDGDGQEGVAAGVVVTLLHQGFPNESASTITAADGSYSFGQLWSGDSVVKVQDTLNGLSVSKAVHLDDFGQVVIQDLLLSPFNAVILQGSVFEADGELAGYTEMRLLLGNEIVNYTLSDQDGFYQLPGLLPRSYVLRFFHPATGQTARRNLDLRQAEGITPRSFVLDGSGSLQGAVLDGSNGQTVPFARVEASGFGFSFATQASDQALFRLEGIPLGDVTLTAAKGGTERKGKALVTLTYHGEALLQDVELKPVGTVRGTVYRRDGTTPVVGAQIDVHHGLNLSLVRTTFTDEQGIYLVDQVENGPLSLTASSPDDIDRGSTNGTLDDSGLLIQDVVMRGIGRVVVKVLQDGNSTPGAIVKIRRLPSGTSETLSENSNHDYLSGDLLLGDFLMSAKSDVFQAKENIILTQEFLNPGDEVVITLTLAESGQIQGSLVDAQSLELPGFRVRATCLANNKTWWDYTDALGQFALDGLPLTPCPSYQVIAGEGDARGRVQASATFDANHFADVGQLQLDPTPPSVLGVFPDVGGLLPRSQRVFQISFSEPMTSSSLSSLKIVHDGQTLAASRSLSANGLVVALTLDEDIPNHALLTMVAGTGLKDLAGNGLDPAVSFQYLTEDSVGPVVISNYPEDGTSHVPGDLTFTVVFDESIDPLTGLVEVNLANQTILSVPGDQRYFDESSKILSFGLQGQIPDNTQVTLTMAGMKDFSGNAMSPLLVHFSTTDSQPPNIVFAYLTTAVEGSPFKLTVTEADSDLARVELRDNQGLVKTKTDNFSNSWNITLPTLQLLGGSLYQPWAETWDINGNHQTMGPLEISLLQDQDPQLAPDPLASDEIALGQTYALVASFADDLPVPSVTLVMTGAIEENHVFTPNQSQGQVSHSIIVPNDLVLPSMVTYQWQIEDSFGHREVSSPTTLRVVSVSEDFALVSSTPENGQINVAADAQLVAIFNRALDPASVAVGSSVILHRGGPVGDPVGITAGVIADGQGQFNTLSVTPDLPLENDMVYYLELSTGLQDIFGLNLNSEISIQFYGPDLSPPMVVSIAPTDGAVNVSLTPQFVVSYNEPVRAETANESTFDMVLENGDGSAVPLVFSSGSEPHQIVVTTEISLVEEAGYIFGADSDLEDLAGNRGSASQAILIHFVTEDHTAPQLTQRFGNPEQRSTTLVGAQENLAGTIQDGFNLVQATSLEVLIDGNEVASGSSYKNSGHFSLGASHNGAASEDLAMALRSTDPSGNVLEQTWNTLNVLNAGLKGQISWLPGAVPQPIGDTAMVIFENTLVLKTHDKVSFYDLAANSSVPQLISEISQNNVDNNGKFNAFLSAHDNGVSSLDGLGVLHEMLQGTDGLWSDQNQTDVSLMIDKSAWGEALSAGTLDFRMMLWQTQSGQSYPLRLMVIPVLGQSVPLVQTQEAANSSQRPLSLNARSNGTFLMVQENGSLTWLDFSQTNLQNPFWNETAQVTLAGTWTAASVQGNWLLLAGHPGDGNTGIYQYLLNGTEAPALSASWLAASVDLMDSQSDPVFSQAITGIHLAGRRVWAQVLETNSAWGHRDLGLNLFHLETTGGVNAFNHLGVLETVTSMPGVYRDNAYGVGGEVELSRLQVLYDQETSTLGLPVPGSESITILDPVAGADHVPGERIRVFHQASSPESFVAYSLTLENDVVQTRNADLGDQWFLDLPSETTATTLTLRVDGIDAAGNTHLGIPNSINLIQDLVPPVAESPAFTNPGTGFLSGVNDITVSATDDSGLKEVRLVLNGQVFHTEPVADGSRFAQFTFIPELEDGFVPGSLLSWQVEAEDLAGNTHRSVGIERIYRFGLKKLDEVDLGSAGIVLEVAALTANSLVAVHLDGIRHWQFDGLQWQETMLFDGSMGRSQKTNHGIAAHLSGVNQGWVVIDLLNPAGPSVLDRFGGGDSALNQNTVKVFYHRRHLYVMDESDQSAYQIFARQASGGYASRGVHYVSDLSEGGTSGMHLFFQGDRMLLHQDGNGLWSLDTTDPSRPQDKHHARSFWYSFGRGPYAWVGDWVYLRGQTRVSRKVLGEDLLLSTALDMSTDLEGTTGSGEYGWLLALGDVLLNGSGHVGSLSLADFTDSFQWNDNHSRSFAAAFADGVLITDGLVRYQLEMSDQTAPDSLELMAPLEGQIFRLGAAMPLQVKSTDDRGIQQLEVFINGTKVEVLSGEAFDGTLWAHSSWPTGPVTLRVEAVDVSGKRTAAEIQITLQAPAASPAIQITVPPPASVAQGTFFSLEAGVGNLSGVDRVVLEFSDGIKIENGPNRTHFRRFMYLSGALSWRLAALDRDGQILSATGWQALQVTAAAPGYTMSIPIDGVEPYMGPLSFSPDGNQALAHVWQGDGGGSTYWMIQEIWDMHRIEPSHLLSAYNPQDAIHFPEYYTLESSPDGMQAWTQNLDRDNYGQFLFDWEPQRHVFSRPVAYNRGRFTPDGRDVLMAYGLSLDGLAGNSRGTIPSGNIKDVVPGSAGENAATVSTEPFNGNSTEFIRNWTNDGSGNYSSGTRLEKENGLSQIQEVYRVPTTDRLLILTVDSDGNYNKIVRLVFRNARDFGSPNILSKGILPDWSVAGYGWRDLTFNGEKTKAYLASINDGLILEIDLINESVSTLINISDHFSGSAPSATTLDPTGRFMLVSDDWNSFLHVIYLGEPTSQVKKSSWPVQGGKTDDGVLSITYAGTLSEAALQQATPVVLSDFGNEVPYTWLLSGQNATLVGTPAVVLSDGWVYHLSVPALLGRNGLLTDPVTLDFTFALGFALRQESQREVSDQPQNDITQDVTSSPEGSASENSPDFNSVERKVLSMSDKNNGREPGQ